MTEEWLTYAEAAIRLGIKIDSAKRRARARRWPRRTGNNGHVQICVPADALPERRAESLPDDPRPILPHDPPASALLEALDMLRKAEVDAASHKARADALAEQVADFRMERDRLVSIIENHTLRPVNPRVGILDRLFRRG